MTVGRIADPSYKNEEQSAGWKEVQWDASRFSSGVYFYRLTAGSDSEIQKMSLIK